MRAGRILLLGATAIVLTAFAAPAASAQDYDANCNPPSAEQRAQTEAMTELNVRLTVYERMVNNVCKFQNKLKRLFLRDPDPDKITNDQILEASKPDVDPVLARMQNRRETNKAIENLKMREERKAWEKRNSNPAEEAARENNERYEREHVSTPVPLTPAAAGEAQPARREPVILPPEKTGGFIQVFEGKVRPSAPGTPAPAAGQVSGDGTMVSPDGIESGHFEKGELQGDGEEVTPDGTWRGGRYEDGRIEGDGFEVREEGGQTVLTDATFKNDKPDGLVTVTYEDGSSRQDVWYKGERAAEGALAAAGKRPVTPDFKTPEQLAAEAQAKFEQLLVSGDAQTLYTMGDQLLAKGAANTAKRAFQAIASRFPASPLAATAIAQLARLEARQAAVGHMPHQQSSGAAVVADPNARYSSVCVRDAEKLQRLVEQFAAEVQYSLQFKQAAMRSFDRCRSYDPRAQDGYQGNLNDYNAIVSMSSPQTNAASPVIREIEKAIANPNYSAELGPVRLAPAR